jgi:hypothetical protein
MCCLPLGRSPQLLATSLSRCLVACTSPEPHVWGQPPCRFNVRLLKTLAAAETTVAVREGNLVRVEAPPAAAIIAYASHNRAYPEDKLQAFIDSQIYGLLPVSGHGAQ